MDRIAAHFGLVPKQDRFPMDYSPHWTELYRQAATFFMATGTDDTKFQLLLHLFEFGPVNPTATTSSNYPSWVPNWSNHRQRVLPYYVLDCKVDAKGPYPASPSRPTLARLSFSSGNLSLHWNPSTAGQVLLSKTWEPTQPQPPEDGDEDEQAITEEHAVAVLQDLFPAPHDDGPNSTPHIAAFSALVDFLLQSFFVASLFDKNTRAAERAATEWISLYFRDLPAAAQIQAWQVNWDILSHEGVFGFPVAAAAGIVAGTGIRAACMPCLWHQSKRVTNRRYRGAGVAAPIGTRSGCSLGHGEVYNCAGG